jgi:hypothetical protein
MKASDYEGGEPLRCPYCRCKKLREKVVDTLDGHGYWAYGSWDPSFNPAFDSNQRRK